MEQKPKEAARQYHFSEETLKSLQELGELLQEFYEEFTSQGYVLENGRIYKSRDKAKS